MSVMVWTNNVHNNVKIYVKDFTVACVLIRFLIALLAIQVKEENSVHGSDEEPDDDSPGASSDEDMSDDNDKQLHDEVWITYHVFIVFFLLC